MQQLAFRMHVKRGFEREYRRRHDEIWPELSSLLRRQGIRDYRIFLDAETGSLFAVLSCPESSTLQGLAEEPLMQRWWAYMRDIMDTNADNSPVTVPLQEVFHLP